MFWVYQDFSYDWIKFLFLSFSHSVACLCAYPAYFLREMVDIWPKERGGFCTFNNSYRQAAKWAITNLDMQGYNYLRNFHFWHTRYGLPYFVGVWMADSLGMCSNNNESYNSLEVQFPIFSESL